MSLLVGIGLVALAVALGGLAALFRAHGRRAMPPIRMFAVVAAASIALLHLLPEALGAVGWPALGALAAGFLGPALLERALARRDHGHDHTHDAPTSALAMGYAAVIAHQAGEGAALASVARLGRLPVGLVLAIAAHTVPLAMVVALRVMELPPRAPGAAGSGRAARATALALGGVALATVGGAVAGNTVEAGRLGTIQPWLLAVVAGLLLHALVHGEPHADAGGPGARALEGAAGVSGLLLGAAGVEEGGWLDSLPWPARIGGVAVVGAAILARAALRARVAVDVVASPGATGVRAARPPHR